MPGNKKPVVKLLKLCTVFIIQSHQLFYKALTVAFVIVLIYWVSLNKGSLNISTSVSAPSGSARGGVITAMPMLFFALMLSQCNKLRPSEALTDIRLLLSAALIASFSPALHTKTVVYKTWPC